jgi:hypothetical protein
MKIEQIPTADLIPYARNTRTHSPEQVAQIAGSIREFGFTNPILIDGENGIIAGHGRVMAASKLGLAKVPCIRLAHLTDTQKRAYIIADNKLALNAGWDEEMLALELGELGDLNFDLSLIGFDESELGDILAEPSAEAEGSGSEGGGCGEGTASQGEGGDEEWTPIRGFHGLSARVGALGWAVTTRIAPFFVEANSPQSDGTRRLGLGSVGQDLEAQEVFRRGAWGEGE